MVWKYSVFYTAEFKMHYHFVYYYCIYLYYIFKDWGFLNYFLKFSVKN